MPRKYIIIGGVVLFLLIVLQVASGPASRIEQGLMDMRYHLRGPMPADTNIVILYFDNDDVTSLGGFPLKRNIYALLIDVLKVNRVKAVAFDIFFGEASLEYPEHDELLAAKAASSGRVVCASYFRRVDAKEISSPVLAQEQFPALGKMPKPALFGAQLQLPYRELLQSAAGIGHTNTIAESSSELPVLIDVGGRSVPALGMEALRVYAGVERQKIQLERYAALLPTGSGVLTIPISADGTTLLNFPGGLASFRHYSCVDVLRSYSTDASSLAGLENKIVLVSVIGEGRGFFSSTPFDAQFPAIGLQATLIDNALERRFLTRVSPVLGAFIIPILFAALLLLLVHKFGSSRGAVFAILLAVLYLATAQLLFVGAQMVLPILPAIVALVAAWFGPVLYENFIVGKRVERLESEKEKVENKLRDSELKLQMLEKELFTQKSEESTPRGSELVEEIKRYKEEIRTLSAQVSDMVVFEAQEAEPTTGTATFAGIVYEQAGKMKGVIDLIQKITSSDANVLILGESGTGKELVARAVHDMSSRKGKVFVAVNCGALTETLLESELFGHEKGSFTGAVKDKVGRFEYADGGTIFLDEIGETSEAFQVKLLRIVQSGEFERVGSTITRKIDARIIAATNKNLRDLVTARRFREDLFYRLNVFSIELPALLERKGDIPHLAEYFVKQEEGGLALSSTVMEAFIQYRWPGNVRELQSAITRAGILARSEGRRLIQIKDLTEEIAAATKGRVDIEDQIIEILRSKKFSRSSISETAEELGGLNRGTVAEYFRGVCFKHFFENSWNEEQAVRTIVKGGDGESVEKVQKKLREYLANVVEGVTAGQGFENVRKSLRPKYKNLPQRYHTILDEVLRAFLEGKWK